jgi:hypothetical protein
MVVARTERDLDRTYACAVATEGRMSMSTDENRIRLVPVLPWQRPPPTRNRKGQWRAGVSGNPRGRPTNARLAAKRATLGDHAELRRAASYDGITPEQFVRLARVVYGRWWQGPLAADMTMSRQGVIRWAKGKHKISLEKERLLLLLCLRRVRAAHAFVRAMFRRTVAAERARQQLAAMPRYKPLTRPGERRAVF